MTAEDEIRALLTTYERALNASDTALAVSVYARDGTFMPTTLPTATGAELEGAYRETFEQIRLASPSPWTRSWWPVRTSPTR